MNAVVIRTGCKINLYLKVGPLRPDGRHDLETLFLPLPEPFDEMRITRAPEGAGLTVSCASPELDPHDNTLSRAYAAYAKRGGFAPPIAVELVKGVPTGAGLGGGSADAAGLLLFLQKTAQAEGRAFLTNEELAAAAAETGADVPFFLLNLPARAKGVGEVLTPCENPVRGLHLLLVCPETHVRTAWAFKALDDLREKNALSEKSRLTVEGVRDTTTFAYEARCENDFEKVVFEAHPELGRIKDALMKEGAETAGLSGTGSTVFGLYENAELAEKTARKLEAQGLKAFRRAM